MALARTRFPRAQEIGIDCRVFRFFSIRTDLALVWNACRADVRPQGTRNGLCRPPAPQHHGRWFQTAP